MDAWLPLLLAISGLPAVATAAWLARSGRPGSRGLALRMALVGIAIEAGAVALHGVGDDAARIKAVVVTLLVVVNLLAIAMVVHVRRHPGDGPDAP